IYDILLATLGELDHPAAVQTLVDESLASDDEEVRRRCVDSLIRLDVSRNIVPYVKALGSKDNVIVNRAAEALGMLGDPEAISPLIDALVTTHKYKIEGGNGMNASFSPSGGGGGFTMGGNGPRIVREAHQNQAVLQALSRLAGGKDLDYDERAWRNWFVSQRASRLVSARRDD
ncbi:MAG: HEAT repeat domain-containing protein, partial [Planctomycetota bacterium]